MNILFWWALSVIISVIVGLFITHFIKKIDIDQETNKETWHFYSWDEVKFFKDWTYIEVAGFVLACLVPGGGIFAAGLVAVSFIWGFFEYLVKRYQRSRLRELLHRKVR